MGLLVPFQPAPADYPNYLADPQPERLRLPAAHWLLLMLVALCLVLRVLMALRIPGVCPDGVLYIALAKNIEAGNLRAAFHDMALNVYPVILAGLHRLGFEWDFAARFWGVVMSSLVVLPLWGWVRRQFDDRVALIACLLYAVHPKFIEWSPEAMRDQTFWLLFTLAIYWLWRAVTELHYSHFIAAGAVITLASLTRIEGIFLLVPLVLWTFWRWRAFLPDHDKSRVYRRRLLRGAAMCVAVFPLLLLVANIVLLCGHSGVATIRFSALARVQPWLASLFGHAADIGSQDALDKPMTVGRMLWIFIPTMARGLGPVFALLMFGGIWGWRRVWARRDHQALFCTAVVFLVAAWVQLWFDKTMCPRYALPIVLMASPFAALGLMGLAKVATVGWAWPTGLSRESVGCVPDAPPPTRAFMVRRGRTLRLAEAAVAVVRWAWPTGLSRAVGHAHPTHSRRTTNIWIAVLFVALAASVTDGLTGNKKYFATRQMARELGCRLGREYRVPPKLVGPPGITPIISYYAGNGQSSQYTILADGVTDTTILGAAAQTNADVVLLRPWKQLTPERCDALIAQFRTCGLSPVRRDLSADTIGVLHVLARSSRLDLVQKPMKQE